MNRMELIGKVERTMEWESSDSEGGIWIINERHLRKKSIGIC